MASYTIKKGDSLLAIAKANGISYDSLLAANPGVRTPSAGVVLRLPNVQTLGHPDHQPGDVDPGLPGRQAPTPIKPYVPPKIGGLPPTKKQPGTPQPQIPIPDRFQPPTGTPYTPPTYTPKVGGVPQAPPQAPGVYGVQGAQQVPQAPGVYGVQTTPQPRARTPYGVGVGAGTQPPEPIFPDSGFRDVLARLFNRAAPTFQPGRVGFLPGGGIQSPQPRFPSNAQYGAGLRNLATSLDPTPYYTRASERAGGTLPFDMQVGQVLGVLPAAGLRALSGSVDPGGGISLASLTGSNNIEVDEPAAGTGTGPNGGTTGSISYRFLTVDGTPSRSYYATMRDEDIGPDGRLTPEAIERYESEVAENVGWSILNRGEWPTAMTEDTRLRNGWSAADLTQAGYFYNEDTEVWEYGQPIGDGPQTTGAAMPYGGYGYGGSNYSYPRGGGGTYSPYQGYADYTEPSSRGYQPQQIQNRPARFGMVSWRI